MIVGYSQSMLVLQAVKRTFSGEEICEVCKLVQAKKKEQDAAGTKAVATKVTIPLSEKSRNGAPAFSNREKLF